MILRRKVLLSFLTFVWLACASNVFADAVETSVLQKDDTATLTFAWPQPVEFVVSQRPNGLDILFQREISTDISVIRRRLPSLVSAVRKLNHRTLRVELKKKVRIKHRRDENLVIVELLSVNANSATAAERIRVRAGKHADKTRLVFDWPNSVGYKVIDTGLNLIIEFDSEARFDLSRVRPAYLDNLDTIKAVESPRGSRVRVSKNPQSPVEHLLVDSKVVVDILKPKPGYTPPDPEPEKPIALSPPKPTEPEARTTEESPKQQQAEVSSNEEKNVSSPKNDDQARGNEDSKPSEPTPPPASDGTTSNSEVTDTKDKEEEAAQAPPKVEDAALRPHEDEAKLRVLVESSGNSARILFPFRDPVAAAALARDDKLWLFFDRALDAERDQADGDTNTVGQISQIDHPSATILQIDSKPKRFAAMRRDQATWILEFSDKALPFEREIAVIARPNSDDGAHVYLPSVDNGSRISFVEPEAGHEIQVVPTLLSKTGVGTPQRFVEFELIPTVQGIAIRPVKDEVALQVERDRIRVTAPGGLKLSTPIMTIGRRGDSDDSAASSSGSPILDILGWGGVDRDGFIEAKTKLFADLARASDAAKNRARFELSKFYLSHGMAQEAVGLMRIIDSDDPRFERNHVYRAARGVAKFLSNDLAAAQEDLFHPDLDNYPDMKLWRGAYHTRAREHDKAVAEFPGGINQLPDIPPPVRQRLLEDWMLAASETSDEGNFIIASELLDSDEKDRRAEATLAWLRGQQAARGERWETALGLYDQAIDYQYRPIRARAQLDKVDVQLALGQIDEVKAIESLEKLYYAWRGDEFELDLVLRLAKLKVANNQYRDALLLLRDGVTQFAEWDKSKVMAAFMDDTFESLYLDGKADEMSPVTALGLYFEFKELTPVGKRATK